MKNVYEWVNSQFKDFGRNLGAVIDTLPRRCKTSYTYSNSSFLCTITDHSVKIVGVGKRNLGRVGVSQCSPNDHFDIRTGIALAWARYKGASIPTAFAPAPRVDTVELGGKVRYAGKKYRVKDCTKRGVYVETKKGKIKLLPPETRVEVIF